MSKIIEHAFAPVGILRVDVLSKGQIIERWDGENLIVDGAKGVLAGLLGSADVTKKITTIGFGTNGAQPVGGNTALTGAFTKALDSVTYPTGTSVQFNFSLATTEANGLAIIEFGLLTAAGTLFSRRVRSTAINKASDISFVGTWTIQF